MTETLTAFRHLEALLKSHRYPDSPPNCVLLPNKTITTREEPYYPTPAYLSFPLGCYTDPSSGANLPLLPLDSIKQLPARKYEVTATYHSESGSSVALPAVLVDLNQPAQPDILCPRHRVSPAICWCYSYVPPHASLFRTEGHSFMLCWNKKAADIEPFCVKSRSAVTRGTVNLAYWSFDHRMWIISSPLFTRRPAIVTNPTRIHHLPRVRPALCTIQEYVAPAPFPLEKPLSLLLPAPTSRLQRSDQTSRKPPSPADSPATPPASVASEDTPAPPNPVPSRQVPTTTTFILPTSAAGRRAFNRLYGPPQLSSGLHWPLPFPQSAGPPPSPNSSTATLVTATETTASIASPLAAVETKQEPSVVFGANFVDWTALRQQDLPVLGDLSSELAPTTTEDETPPGAPRPPSPHKDPDCAPC